MMQYNRLTTEKFIKKSKIIHGDKYNYSLVEINGVYNKVKIICPIHGIFEQSPNSHFRGYECEKCGRLKANKTHTLNNEKFIKKAKEIHGDKYDYSLVEYKTSKINVKIICPIHGIFEQLPSNHINKSNPAGCSFCFGTKKLTTEEFIENAVNLHGDRYDYSLVKYEKNNKKVKIICKKHGITFDKSPTNHIFWSSGCPICKSSTGEMKIFNFLKNKEIYFEPQYSFKNCRNALPLPFDFYLPDHNCCIEYDGIQHFKPIEYFGGEESLKNLQINDKIKNEYCNKNNIKLLRIKYTDDVMEKLELNFNI